MPAGYEYPFMAEGELRQAFRLSEAVYGLDLEINRSPPDMPADDLARRKAILGIAKGMLVIARDKAMDNAAHLWKHWRDTGVALHTENVSQEKSDQNFGEEKGQ
jgi:hypothetical protein